MIHTYLHMYIHEWNKEWWPCLVLPRLCLRIAFQPSLRTQLSLTGLPIVEHVRVTSPLNYLSLGLIYLLKPPSLAVCPSIVTNFVCTMARLLYKFGCCAWLAVLNLLSHCVFPTSPFSGDLEPVSISSCLNLLCVTGHTSLNPVTRSQNQVPQK